MAWTISEYFGPYNWQHFSFFKTWGSLTTDFLAESVSMANGKPWRLAEIRLHLSTAMGSTKYFQVMLSSVKDSLYNVMIVSWNYANSTDMIWRYFSDMSNPIMFLSGDTLNFYGSVTSVADIHGLQVIGWGVI